MRCRQPNCGFEGALRDGILNCMDGRADSFFDSRFPVMVHGADEPGPRTAFYEQQVEAAVSRLANSSLIVDVGCGPRLPYRAPNGSTVIGVDVSYESLRQNRDVGVRVYGSARRLPLRAESADAVVCFYSLHHMVGTRIEDNEHNVGAALREFGRVLRPGGRLLIFEVSPWTLAWLAQRVTWNVMRHLLGRRYDMFFWSKAALGDLLGRMLPRDGRVEVVDFSVPPLTTFPPAFALRRFRIPRLIYPFHICLFEWLKPHNNTTCS